MLVNCTRLMGVIDMGWRRAGDGIGVRTKALRLVLVGILLTGLLTTPVRAQIATDGTVGPMTNLMGPNFSIPATLGTQTGSNLFHSFLTFNVRNGEIATFTGPPGLDNVISRVTGGQSSLIDGFFSSTIPGADVWFLNPAGVIFGENAIVDVPGSLHVGTGDEIQFDDGAVFNATTPSLSTLTLASPEAFGFLGSNPGSINVNQSFIVFNAGETLSLIGGDVTIDDSFLLSNNPQAQGGTINLISVASPNTVSVSDGTTATAADGEIRVVGSSVIDVSGNGGGSARIRGGQFIVDNSTLSADNNGADVTGEGLLVEADTVQVTDSQIFSSAFDVGDAVPIAISATNLTVTDSLIFSDSLGLADGTGGDGGAITLTADTIRLNGAFVTSESLSATGDSGSITIQGNQVDIVGFSSISTDTLATEETATATTGDIDITAGTLVIDDSRVTSNSVFGGGDDSGSITINADLLDMNNDARIASSTNGNADAGTIEVVVGTLSMDDSSIVSNTDGAGQGGSVTIIADQIDMTNFSSIEARSSNFFDDDVGDAGTIVLNGGDLTMDRSDIVSNTDSVGLAGC